MVLWLLLRSPGHTAVVNQPLRTVNQRRSPRVAGPTSFADRGDWVLARLLTTATVVTTYRVLCATWAVLATLGTPAQAQEQPEPRTEPAISQPALPSPPTRRSHFEERPVALLGTLGLLGSPVGVLGLELEYAPFPWLVLMGGGGTGVAGLQGALGARFRHVTSERVAVGAGAGVSHGRYRPLFYCFDQGNCKAPVAKPLWLNAEATFETRASTGVSYRLAVGLSSKLACDGVECGEAFSDKSSLPYITASLGYAF